MTIGLWEPGDYKDNYSILNNFKDIPKALKKFYDFEPREATPVTDNPIIKSILPEI